MLYFNSNLVATLKRTGGSFRQCIRIFHSELRVRHPDGTPMPSSPHSLQIVRAPRHARKVHESGKFDDVRKVGVADTVLGCTRKHEGTFG